MRQASSILIVGVLVSLTACSSQNEPQVKRSSNAIWCKGEKPKPAITDADAYLLDLTDAAADAPANPVSQIKVTATVTADIAETPLNKTTSRLFDIADTDDSGAITIDEFLKAPQILRKIHKHHQKSEMNDDQKQRLESRLKDDFEEFAGADALLSDEELKTLILAYAPLIADRREKGHGWKHHHPHDDGEEPNHPEHPAPPTWDEIMAKYDKNADGMLNKDEFEALRKDRHKRPHQE